MPSAPFALPDEARLLALLDRCWSRDTSSAWSPETPSRGQCGVTALVHQDHFGGEILNRPVVAFLQPGGGSGLTHAILVWCTKDVAHFSLLVMPHLRVIPRRRIATDLLSHSLD